MINRLLGLLFFFLLFSHNTYSMDQQRIERNVNQLTENQKKHLIEKYASTTFLGDLFFFYAYNYDIWTNNSLAVNFTLNQWDAKVAIMEGDGRDDALIADVRAKYLNHLKVIGRGANLCNGCLVGTGVSLALMGIIGLFYGDGEIPI